MSLGNLAGVVRRQWLVVAAVLLAGIVAFIVLTPLLKRFTATSTVLAVSSPSTTTSELDPQKDPSAGAVTPTDLSTVLETGVVLQRVARDLHMPESQALILQNNIKAKVPLGSSLIPIAFTDVTPSAAIAGANAAAKELSDYDRTISTSRYDRLIADLDQEIKAEGKRLSVVDREIANLTSSDVYASADNGTAAVNARLLTLSAQRDQLAATVASDQAGSQVAEQRPAISHDLALKEVQTNSPTVVALQTQYGKDLADYNVTKAGYTSLFAGLAPMMAKVRSEMRDLKSEVSETASNPKQSNTYVASLLDANKAQGSLASDRAALAAVDTQIGQLTSHLDNSGDENTKIASLRRERAADEAAFTSLSDSASKASADRAQASEIESVVVIDKATLAPQVIYSRSYILGPALAVVFIWLALSLGVLIDNGDRRLRTTNSIEDLYGKPVYQPVG